MREERYLPTSCSHRSDVHVARSQEVIETVDPAVHVGTKSKFLSCRRMERNDRLSLQVRFLPATLVGKENRLPRSRSDRGEVHNSPAL